MQEHLPSLFWQLEPYLGFLIVATGFSFFAILFLRPDFEAPKKDAKFTFFVGLSFGLGAFALYLISVFGVIRDSSYQFKLWLNPVCLIIIFVMFSYLFFHQILKSARYLPNDKEEGGRDDTDQRLFTGANLD